MPPAPRRHFRTRVLTLVLGLLCAALTAIYFSVSQANRTTAQTRSEEGLEQALHLFTQTAQQRIEYLAASASVINGDAELKALLAPDQPDVALLSALLRAYTGRIGAPVIALFTPNGRLLANSEPALTNENIGPFAYLIRMAAPATNPTPNGFSYLKSELHALVVVPLHDPFPHVVGWLGLAFPIDRAFAEKIKATSHSEITLVSTEDPAHPRILATTLPAATAPFAAAAVALNRREPTRFRTLDFPGERQVTLFKIHDMLGEEGITLILQRSLTAELATARILESHLLLISLVALTLGTLLALFIARDVSQPIVALVGHTQRISRGDYSVRNTAYRPDELGRLSEAFDQMARGLDERDRVRDLLDKNVSPEIAAQLLRDGAALGGEERQVSILFADLCGFTTLSEQLPPQELLALLNRYLDRMSTALEAHGGVIDKYIGDAIMALFGAPIAHGDDADRALAAALAMEAALATLNTELAAEGKAPLSIGIGINTARVVAGNIGSTRRLNYSVIGDGVNVAARIESLTRKPDYRATIITTAATLAALARPSFPSTPPDTASRSPTSRSPTSESLSPNTDVPACVFRPLGLVVVKGRAESVEIFAVE